jgi:class 3 adenylate cyclase/tetratricopeptide (TPR) repeat protein
VPAFQRAWWASDDERLRGPHEEEIHAAVMFLDVVGFTKLAALLEGAGPDGAELLATALNDGFGRVVDIIETFGGEVVTLVGDAVIAFWRVEGSDGAVNDAVGCGLEVLEDARRAGPTKGTAVTLRGSISVGSLRLSQVGGHCGRWLSLAVGPALDDIAGVDAVIARGELGVSRSVWDLVSDVAEGDRRGDGYRVRALREFEIRSRMSDSAPVKPEVLLSLLPAAVADRLVAGRSALLDEFRSVSAVFTSIGGGLELQDLHRLVLDFQRVIERFEGTVDKLTADEKGVSLFAVFGYPGQASTWAPARAVAAARAMIDASEGASGSVRAGVATGRAFCGQFGGRAFRQYSAVAAVVNRAARLVGAAEAGQILCDDPTSANAAAAFEFRSGPQVVGKPGEAPFRSFEPSAMLEGRKRIGATGLFGRERELKELQHLLVAVAERVGNTLVIEGEPGAGKSRLLSEFERMVDDSRTRLVWAQASPLRTHDPYHCWETVVLEMLGLDEADRSDAAATVVTRCAEAGLPDYAAVLNPVTGLKIEPSDAVRRLGPEARSHHLLRLLRAVLHDAADREPIVLVLDDLHYADSASLSVLRAMADVPNVLIVVATRPAAPSPELTHLKQRGVMALGGVDREDARSIAERALDARLSSDLANHLVERAGGNPLHIEQLVLALSDAGLITVTDGVAHVRDRTIDLDRVPMTESLEVAVASRVDQLPLNQQLCLQVASVIARSITHEAVSHVADHTVEAEAALTELATQRLIARVGASMWEFEHSLVQQAIYERIPFARRRKMHAAAARWLQATLEPDQVESAAFVLAFHHVAANEWDLAIGHLETAANRALADNAAPEAARLFEQAVNITDSHMVAVAPARRAAWLVGLAEASYRHGRMDRTIERAAPAFDALGHEWSDQRSRMVLGLLSDLARHLTGRTRTASAVSPDDPLLEALRLNNRVTEAYIFEQDPVGCLYSAMREVDLARQLGRDPELARALTVLALVLGVTPLRRFGARLLDHARVLVSAADTEPMIRAYVLTRGCAFRIQGGRFEGNRSDLDEATALCERFGDVRLAGEAIGVQGFTDHYTDSRASARQCYLELRSWAQSSYDDQYHALASASLADLALRSGQLDVAEDHLHAALPWVRSDAVAAEFIMTVGTLARLRIRQGDRDAAWEEVGACLQRSAAGPPTAFWTYIGVEAAATVCLELWHDALRRGETHRAAGYHAAAKTAIRQLRIFSLVFGLGRPAATYGRARYLQITGHTTRANRLFERAEQLADERGMRWEADRARSARQETA